jgi:metal-responsive CopG/Arc/MetJ family transcriptional regulator
MTQSATVPIMLKIPKELVDKIDAFRERQPFVPSRQAVIRSMIEAGFELMSKDQ